MARTPDETWWLNLRWRMAVGLLGLAVRIMPNGDARADLHARHLAWIYECKRQWTLRYGSGQ